MKKITWCVFWFDKNRKCFSVEVDNSNGVDNMLKARSIGIEKLKALGCKIKKDYEVDIKILSIDNALVEHIAEF